MTSNSEATITIKLVQTLSGHNSDVNCVLFTENEKKESILTSCSSDKTIRLWNLDDQSSKTLTRHSYQVHCLSFASIVNEEKPTSIQYMASVSTDGTCLLWDLKTLNVLKEYRHDSGSPIRVSHFSPDGLLLATAGDDQLINLWDITATLSRPLKTFAGHSESIVALRFVSNLLISGSFYGDLKVWTLDSSFTGPVQFQREAHDLGVTCLDAFDIKKDDGTSSGMAIVASGGNDNQIKIWSCSSKSKTHLTFVRTLKKHSTVVMCVSFGPEDLLASGSGDRTIIIWNFQTGLCFHQFEAHSRYVTCCAFSSDGRYLASGSNDRAIKLWQIDLKKSDSVEVTDEKCDYHSVPIDQWTVDLVKQWLNTFRVRIDVEMTGHDLLMRSDEEIADMFDSNQRLINSLSALRHENFMKNLLKHRTKTNTTSSSNSETIPNEFLCPITQELMTDPVCASDGYTYERKAIEGWLQKKKTSPIMNVPMKQVQLYSNKVLKMLIDKHAEASSTQF